MQARQDFQSIEARKQKITESSQLEAEVYNEICDKITARLGGDDQAREDAKKIVFGDKKQG